MMLETGDIIAKHRICGSERLQMVWKSGVKGCERCKRGES